MSDPVKKPDHYRWHPSGVECATIADAFPFAIGSAIKYLWRADHKGKPIEDMRKAIACIEREIARREAAEKKPAEATKPRAVGGFISDAAGARWITWNETGPEVTFTD